MYSRSLTKRHERKNYLHQIFSDIGERVVNLSPHSLYTLTSAYIEAFMYGSGHCEKAFTSRL